MKPVQYNPSTDSPATYPTSFPSNTPKKFIFLAVDSNGVSDLGSVAYKNYYPNMVLDEENGQLYFTDLESSKLLRKNLSNLKDETLYTTSPGNLISSIGLINGGGVFVSDAKVEDFDAGIGAILKNISPTTRDVRVIGKKDPGIYSNFHYLFGSSGYDVVNSYGGDGCGGGGTVYRVASQNFTKIAELGGGCNEKPILVGRTTNGGVLLASIVKNSFENPFTKYETLYSLNVDTMEVKGIFDFRSIQKQIFSFVQDRELDKVAVAAEDGMHIINIDSSKESVAPITLKSGYVELQLFENDKVYFYDQNNVKLKIVDINDNSVKEIDLQKNGVTKKDYVNILGVWNNKIIVSVQKAIN